MTADKEKIINTYVHGIILMKLRVLLDLAEQDDD